MRKTTLLVAVLTGLATLALASIAGAADSSAALDPAFDIALLQDQGGGGGGGGDTGGGGGGGERVGIDVNVTESGGETVIWYTDPVWIAVGVVVLILIVVLIALAARGGGGSTTVVK